MGLLLTGGTLVSPQGTRKADLLIAGEKILAVEETIPGHSVPGDTRIIDASGMYVLPGFIDAHTHYGLGEGEDRTADGFYEGSVAAAFGGITTFIDFADHPRKGTLAEGALTRIGEAKDSVIDFALHQGLYRMHPDIPRELDELKRLGVTALKLFTTYRQFGVYLDPSAWKDLFPLCRDKRLLVTIHAEDDELIETISRDMPPKGLGPEMHPVLRPPRAEASAFMKAGEAAGEHGMPVYFVHVSSEDALRVVRKLRKGGVRVVAETAPHYLFLTGDHLRGPDGPLYLMTPPLRTERDNRILIEALSRGEIDIVATDHCSYTPEQKKRTGDCRFIPAGVPGSGEAAVLLYSLGTGGSGFDIERLSAVFSRNPAKVFGLYPEKGSLQPGTDADIVVFSPDKEGTLSAATVKTMAGYTPYDGFRYFGAPVMTISRGKIIVVGDNFLGDRGTGRFLRSGESSVY